MSDIALKHELPEAVAKSMAAYVGCIAGAILIDEYRSGLSAAGLEHIQIVDSGADLNAYAKVENQAGCCSPSMETGSPFQVVSEPCCAPASEPVPSFHDELTTLLSQYDINAAAASVKVYAIKPTTTDALSARSPFCTLTRPPLRCGSCALRLGVQNSRSAPSGFRTPPPSLAPGPHSKNFFAWQRGYAATWEQRTFAPLRDVCPE